MIRSIFVAAALSAFPFASAQGQTQPPVPAPGKWEVKVAPAECSLIRSVQGEAPALLAVRTMPGADSYAVLLSGRDVPDRGKGEGLPAKLIFDGTSALDGRATPVGKLATGPALQFLGLAPSMLDSFAGAHTIAAGIGSRSFGSFDIPHAREAVAALRKCVADQLTDWGADPAQFAPGGAAPVALKDRDDWLTNAQLMMLAEGSDQAGVDYLYRVTIGTDGTIESCKLETAEAGDKAEKIGCAPVLGRKLFTPARNAAGVPVKGVATFRAMVIRRPMSR